MLQENHEAFFRAINDDLGKPREESYPHEISAVIVRACLSAEKLEEWSKPDKSIEKPEWQKSWLTTVHTVPRGLVLIIS
jgi:aldehyde dehydrogenase (NAD+)